MNTKAKGHTAKPPRITNCVCDHKAQDAYHGKGNRVHNPCNTNEPDKTGYRCTVCGREHAH